jgi:type II secretory pathway component GspD/PulD (secretin)
VVYDREVEQLTKSLVAEPILVLQEKEVQMMDFNFDDTPANEVFEVLEKAYGIHIIFDADLLKNCPVTAPLSNQNLYKKLKIICKAIEAEYVLIDGQIIIQSKGCK